MTEFRSFDPSTGLLVTERPEADVADIDAALTRAFDAFQAWSRRSPADRGAALRGLAGRLREHRDAHARIMAEEIGKPILQAEAEIEKCARAIEHAADHAPAWLEAEPVSTEAERSYVRYDPLGVVLAIMPWNFPFWQVI